MISLTFSNLFLTFLALILLHVFHRYVLRPILLVRYYAKQGFTPNYRLITGELGQYDSFARQYRDCHLPLKKRLNEDPNFIGTVSPLGDKVCIYLADHKLIRNVAATEGANLIKYNHFIWPWQEFVSTAGLTFTEGEQHKKFKRILSRSFNFEFLKRNMGTITGIIDEAFEDMEQKGLDVVAIVDVIGSITSEVIGRTYFGFDHRTAMFKGRRIISAVFDVESACAKMSQTFSYQVFGAKFVKLGIMPSHRADIVLCRDFRKHCMGLVQNRKKNILADRNNANLKYLIDNLFLAQIDNSNDALTDDQILDQYITFFLAGQQNASHMLTLTLYALAKVPEFVELMRKEIKEQVPSIDTIEFDDLAKLEYLNAAIKEGFRMYSPLQILFFREATKNFKIENINVLKGTLVNVYAGYAAFSEKYFQNYDKFDPMRWVGENNKLDASLVLPFWAGTRTCIGQHLSMLEVRSVLIRFVSKYNFKVKEDFKLRLTQTISYAPLEWHTMNLTKIK